MTIQVITDSASALGVYSPVPENISVLPMTVSVEGNDTVYGDEDTEEFYSFVNEHKNNPPKLYTSQPSISAIEETMTSAAKAGCDVLAIVMSSAMSGTFSLCCSVADEVKKRFPTRRFAIIDSTSNAMDEGFAVLDTAKLAEGEDDLDRCVDTAMSSILRSKWLFSVENLKFLQAGGRIGKAAAFAADKLKIAPILSVKDGETELVGKVRFFSKAMDKIARIAGKDIHDHGLEKAIIHYVGNRAAAEEWLSSSALSQWAEKIEIVPAPPVITAHVGPALGMVYKCLETIENKVSLPREELVYQI